MEANNNQEVLDVEVTDEIEVTEDSGKFGGGLLIASGVALGYALCKGVRVIKDRTADRRAEIKDSVKTKVGGIFKKADNETEEVEEQPKKPAKSKKTK